MGGDILAADIPSHWEFTTLGEVCRRGGGSIQTGPFGSQLHASDYVSVGVPSIMPTNIGDNRIVEDGIVRITEADAARLSQHRVQDGDIVYSRRGDVEKRALIRRREAGWLCGTGCLKVRLGHGVVDPVYASYFLGHPAIREWIVRHAIGATMPNLNTSIMSAVPFALPPLAEQRAIARILGALDDKIELNRKLNATLEAMARALFKSWFIDFDPVRAKAEGRAPSGMDAETAKLFPHEFVDSELGTIPKGWRATTLGTEVERCGGAVQTGPFGSQLHASDYVPEGVPVVMPKDIGGRRVSTASIARVREVDAARLSRHRLQPGDVVYSRRGDVERHALIGARETGWLCGTGCLLVRLGPSWPSPMFASFALDRPETRAWISQHAIGATMPNLNTGILSAVPLVMPSDDVLRAFARAVDPLQALVVIRDAEAGLLAKTRDELLPRLLSGELLVDAAERAVEEVA
jgi:type I restriction enzyme S subunit